MACWQAQFGGEGISFSCFFFFLFCFFDLFFSSCFFKLRDSGAGLGVWVVVVGGRARAPSSSQQPRRRGRTRSSLLHFSRRCPRTSPAPPWNRGSYRDGRTERLKKINKKNPPLPRPTESRLIGFPSFPKTSPASPELHLSRERAMSIPGWRPPQRCSTNRAVHFAFLFFFLNFIFFYITNVAHLKIYAGSSVYL